MELKGAVCQALRSLREFRNKTQEQVRFEIGCDVSNIENNRCCPNILAFVKLCDYYRVDAGRFLTLIKLSHLSKIHIKILIVENFT